MLTRLSAMTFDHLGRPTRKLVDSIPQICVCRMAGALIGAEVMGGEFNILA
jgi:hypothetical protein